MSLTALQDRFLATVTEAEGSTLLDWPADMSDGLQVYRNAYRSRLLDCLRGTFEKSRHWIGDESFDAAAAHHLILHPPASWTLDDLGLGFSDTLAALFPDDPEVEELAWLEWEMQRIFTGPDVPVLAAADFAWRGSAFTEEDWLVLRLTVVPTIVEREVRTECAALWTAIDQETDIPSLSLADADTHLLVWRQDLRSQFRLIGDDEAVGLALMRSAGTFEQLCETLVQSRGDEDGVAAAGAMLGRWVTDGLISDVAVAR